MYAGKQCRCAADISLGPWDTKPINIDFPSEYLTGISGTHGSACSLPNSVTSLTFITNKTQYGPCGTICGTHFSVNANDAVVTGFHGRCGKYVEGIGLYIKPVKPCDESDNGVFSAVEISLKANIKARVNEGLWKIISENLHF
ncbi:hypothetical protein SASPL_157548 [Salvia splendens]|uniref:Jacalin-type lectin domain-containing protein n=1 Tax=Salvia splendens TaxID=180675 RepID=A0A8X8VUR1_SALSN|nr:hypothetical protein SASPL_157548 [Salvia splendens]